jgi:diguanylate cyclase (GGDEF)-like protein/PAS domain S-box-containing protein
MNVDHNNVDHNSAPHLRIADLVDIPHIQALADANFAASGLPMTMIDAIDDTILVSAGWPGMCKEFHRAHPDASRRCMESDREVLDRLGESETAQYKCKNGLWHIGIPIMVHRSHLATLFITQFFLEGETIDREYFTLQGQQFGFEVNAYLAALEQMPVFSEQKIAYGLAFYKVMARFIAEMAQQSLAMNHAKDSLREKEEYQSLVQNVNIGVYRIAMPNRFIRANKAMAEIFGYESVEELVTRPINDMYYDREEREAILEELGSKGVISDRLLHMKRKDGAVIWASMTAKAQFGADGAIESIDGVVEDVTLRKKTTDELRDLSEKDALTKILNRRKLSEVLYLEADRARRDGRPLSLIFFDIDRFKSTNDRFGHEAGDNVLKITVEIVSEQLRRSDTFARYGGDEFVVLCPDTDVAGARCLAEKIRRKIEAHDFPIAGRTTISAGVASFHESDLTETAALVRADEALYSAKSSGRNMIKIAAD